MEYDDLDGYEDATDLAIRINDNLRKARSFAAMRDSQKTRTCLESVGELLNHEYDLAQTNLVEARWHLSDKNLDRQARSKLEENFPFFELAVEAAEMSLHCYRITARELLKAAAIKPAV